MHKSVDAPLNPTSVVALIYPHPLTAVLLLSLLSADNDPWPRVRHKAVLCIKFVIIGASIAGLACAYTLRQAGHDVRVVEAQPQNLLGKSPSGVRIPPNMSKILMRWNLGPEFQKKMGGRCPEVLFRSGYSGELIGEILFHKEVMKVMEAEFCLMHHGDLVMALYDLAERAGVQFDFSTVVTAVDPSGPSVILCTGEQIFGDVIIGAGGDKSIVRLILQDGLSNDKDSPFTSSMFTVPTSKFLHDEELLDLVKGPQWNIWMGTGWAVFSSSIRGGSELAVTFYREEKDTTARRGWRQTVPEEELNFDEFEFEPRLKRLMRLASGVVRLRDVIQAPLESWFDEAGHLLVVGQAAHYISPSGNHVAALCVEDAVILGGLFSRLKSRSQIKALLGAFQELRESRYEVVRVSEVDKLAVVTIPPGPLRDARDATMRKEREVGINELAKSPDEYLRTSLEEFRVFGYDAFDEVDTWWVEWGMLLEHMHGTNGGHRNSIDMSGQIFVQSHRNTH
ncbi:hypothetical protein M0805_009795 [Coniferiporia weirii]|nr:hypothetical protein M0805_009795 [Coniferiporia weirii]